MSLFRTITLFFILLESASCLTDLSIGSAYRAAGPDLSASLSYDAGPEDRWSSQDDEQRSLDPRPAVEDEETVASWDEQSRPMIDQQMVEPQSAQPWESADQQSRPEDSYLMEGTAASWDEQSRPLMDQQVVPPSGGFSGLSADLSREETEELNVPAAPEASALQLEREHAADIQLMSTQDAVAALGHVTEAAVALEKDAAMLSGQLQVLASTLQNAPASAASEPAAHVTTRRSRPQPTLLLTQQDILQQRNGSALGYNMTGEVLDNCPLGQEKCGRLMKWFTLNYQMDLEWAMIHWVIVLLFWCFLCWCCCKCCGRRQRD